MKLHVEWSPLALRRAAEAADFIASDNPSAALRWTRGLIEAVAALSRFPRRGRMVPEVGRPEIREIIYRNHRVVYRLSPRLLEVLTVRHSRRRFAFAEIQKPE